MNEHNGERAMKDIDFAFAAFLTANGLVLALILGLLTTWSIY